MSIAQANAQARHAEQVEKAMWAGYADAALDTGFYPSNWKFPPLRSAYEEGYARGLEVKASPSDRQEQP